MSPSLETHLADFSLTLFLVVVPLRKLGEPMANLKAPKANKIDQIVAEANSRREDLRAEMGLVGRFFGSRHNAAVYISAFLAMLCLLVACIGYATASSEAIGMEFAKTFGSFFLACVGYLFGFLTGDNK
jgi:hypothetical protein